MIDNIINKYKTFCDNRKTENKYRQLPLEDPRDFLNFSSNDYLLFASADNYDAIEYATEIAKKYGLGATGSRLLSGNNKFIEEFEKQIAKDKNTEGALIFNSGYQANLSVLSSLCNSSVIGDQAYLFFDKSNHSSLYQGAFLSGAKLFRYNNCDLDQLEILLNKYKDDKNPKFIVSETIFGMDGTVPDLEKLIDLSKQYNALLYLDEAHATGLYGKNSYGFSSDYNSSYDKIISMGTFSKALGSAGGYIASNKIIIDYLINNCHGFIYSTAPSPTAIAVAKFNWDRITSDNCKTDREKIKGNSEYLREELSKLQTRIKFEKISILKTNNNSSINTNIILIGCATAKICLEIKDYFYSKKILVSAIRPPTVLTSRIRIAINTGHTIKDLNVLVEVLELYLSS